MKCFASAAKATRGRSTPTRYSLVGPLSLLGPLLDRAGRLHLFAQHELLDLAGRRFGQLAEDDPFRRLEACEVLPAMFDQIGFGHARSWLHFDEGAWRLAPLRIGLGDDRRGQHRRMAVERVLDLARAD